jgi:hypothetical protein
MSAAKAKGADDGGAGAQQEPRPAGRAGGGAGGDRRGPGGSGSGHGGGGGAVWQQEIEQAVGQVRREQGRIVFCLVIAFFLIAWNDLDIRRLARAVETITAD